MVLLKSCRGRKRRANRVEHSNTIHGAIIIKRKKIIAVKEHRNLQKKICKQCGKRQSFLRIILNFLSENRHGPTYRNMILVC